METVPFHPIVQVTNEDMMKTREFYEINDVEMIRESLDKVQEWISKQPHLVEAGKKLSTDVLERFFILSRGSVEGTKSKIEKLFTTRGMIPELCLNKSFFEFEKLFDSVYYLPLPKLNKRDMSRVMITKFNTDKLDDFDLLTYFRYNFLVGEYRLNYDYFISERYILDLHNVTFGFLLKLNPIIIKKADTLSAEGYGTKISGIHILNAPSFVDKFIIILKSSLREKVASRIHVHGSYEDLHKHIDKDILPKDYGGNEQCCDELAERWKEILKSEDATEIIKEMDKLVADESRRDTSKFNEEYMGMPGSFRKLNVD